MRAMNEAVWKNNHEITSINKQNNMQMYEIKCFEALKNAQPTYDIG